MAGQRNIYRIARTLLLALAALLAVGAVGSMFLGSRAVSQAKAAAVDQAARPSSRTPCRSRWRRATSPLPRPTRRPISITARITPVLLDPTAWDDVAIWSIGRVRSSTRPIARSSGSAPKRLVAACGTRPRAERSPRNRAAACSRSSPLCASAATARSPPRSSSRGPTTLIVAAGRPWRYNAILMTARPDHHALRALPGHATHRDVHRERELLELHEGPRRARHPSVTPNVRSSCRRRASAKRPTRARRPKSGPPPPRNA